MATLDFSRAENKDYQVSEDRLFNAIIDYTRDDEVSVDFTSKTIKMDIMKSRGQTPIVTLTSGSEITIATARLTFNKTFTDLLERSYDYLLYNDTNKIGIQYGKFIVI